MKTSLAAIEMARRLVVLFLSASPLPTFASCTRAPSSPGVQGEANAAATAVDPSPGSRAAFEYEVGLGEGGRILEVAATFSGPTGDLAFLRGAGAYASEVEATPRGGELAGETLLLAANAGAVYGGAPCDQGCRIHYRYDLGRAASELDADDEARTMPGGALEAPLPTFLLHPLEPSSSATFSVRVRESASLKYATGGIRLSDGAVDVRGPARELAYAPYGVFGPIDRMSISVPGTPGRTGPASTVHLVVPKARYAVPRSELDAWMRRSANAVAALYGRFPIDGAMVALVPEGKPAIGFGRTMAGGGTGAILVDVGSALTAADLKEDWVLPHEMIHLAFPSLPREQRWLEEGLATYLEPVARVRAGMLTEKEAWASLLHGLPSGLPGPGDLGLDRTFTWGRVYWGGALFCFMADLAIREKTRGKKGLPDAMRAVLEAGGDDRARWDVERALAIGDKGTGVAVLLPMYRRWSVTPVPVDLPTLFDRLGVTEPKEDAIVFRDAAPGAGLRKSVFAVP